MEFKIFEFSKDEFIKSSNEIESESALLNMVVKKITCSDEFILKVMNDTIETLAVLFEKGYTNAYHKSSPLSMLLTKRTNEFDPKPYFKSKIESIIEGDKVIGKILIEKEAAKSDALNFIIEESINDLMSVVGLSDEESVSAQRKIVYELSKTTTKELIQNATAMFSNDKITDANKILVALLFSAFGTEAIDVVDKFTKELEAIVS